MSKERSATEIADALTALDLPLDDSMIEHMKVFVEALDIYVDRRERYGDGWKLYGWMDSLFHMRNKFTRTEREFWHSPPESPEQRHARLDNPFDLLNYTAFFIRNVYHDNERGRDT